MSGILPVLLCQWPKSSSAAAGLAQGQQRRPLVGAARRSALAAAHSASKRSSASPAMKRTPEDIICRGGAGRVGQASHSHRWGASWGERTAVMCSLASGAWPARANIGLTAHKASRQLGAGPASLHTCPNSAARLQCTAVARLPCSTSSSVCHARWGVPASASSSPSSIR